jgi:TonB family protein
LRLPAVALLILLLPCIANSAGIADERVSMSQKMADAIEHSGVHNLYVPDFCDSNSQPNGPGAYFAAVFSAMLQKRTKDFTILSRVAAHNFLLKNQWTDCDLGKTDVLGKFAAALGADAILTGGVTPEKNYFFVDLILRDASGKPQIHWVYQEPYSPYTLGAFPASASSAGWPFYFPALDGLSYPKPIKLQHPPNPPDKLGVVVISILVTTDGNVDQARVVQKLDASDDGDCLKSVKKWHFEPAKNSDGTPVPVRIAVYYRFRGRAFNIPPAQMQYPEDQIPQQ